MRNCNVNVRSYTHYPDADKWEMRWRVDDNKVQSYAWQFDEGQSHYETAKLLSKWIVGTLKLPTNTASVPLWGDAVIGAETFYATSSGLRRVSSRIEIID